MQRELMLSLVRDRHALFSVHIKAYGNFACGSIDCYKKHYM